MKLLKTFAGAVLIGALSLCVATLSWWLTGPPDRSVPCDEETLELGYVCLKTVKAWGEGEYLWVDARTRELWNRNGVLGSVLLTDDSNEDYFELENQFMDSLFNEGEIYPNVVIYCNASGCETSQSLANKLREEVAADFGFKVHVLHGGWKALAAEEMTRN